MKFSHKKGEGFILKRQITAAIVPCAFHIECFPFKILFNIRNDQTTTYFYARLPQLVKWVNQLQPSFNQDALVIDIHSLGHYVPGILQCALGGVTLETIWKPQLVHHSMAGWLAEQPHHTEKH